MQQVQPSPFFITMLIASAPSSWRCWTAPLLPTGPCPTWRAQVQRQRRQPQHWYDRLHWSRLAVCIPISGCRLPIASARARSSPPPSPSSPSRPYCAAAPNRSPSSPSPASRHPRGIGGAMMVPVGRLVVLRTAPKDRLAQAIAYITWPAPHRHGHRPPSAASSPPTSAGTGSSSSTSRSASSRSSSRCSGSRTTSLTRASLL